MTIRIYQHPTEPRTFYGPDREPSVELGVPLWHITGLDNFSLPRPAGLSQVLTAKGQTTGSGPGGNFLGSDLRAAYYGETALTGSGHSFHDIVRGSNGTYSAHKGYDLVTGWGGPNGSGLMDLSAH